MIARLAILTSLILPAAAAADVRQTASLRFTTPVSGAASGTVLDIDYRDPSDGGKPPVVRRVVTKLAKGARYDTSVPDACEASDAELMLQGSDACPEASQVGTGSLTLDTGFSGAARYADADVAFYNRADELIFVNTIRDTPARTILRAPIKNRTTTSDVPTLPGTPPDGAAIKRVHFVDDVVVRDGRSYITTPSRCPKSRVWTNRVTLTYADGVTQAVKATSPCKRKKQRRPPRRP
jgi:hypothetical protein